MCDHYPSLKASIDIRRLTELAYKEAPAMPALLDQYAGAACLGHATFLQIIPPPPSPLWMRVKAAVKRPEYFWFFCHCPANALGYLFKQGNLNSTAISTLWGTLHY